MRKDTCKNMTPSLITETVCDLKAAVEGFVNIITISISLVIYVHYGYVVSIFVKPPYQLHSTLR